MMQLDTFGAFAIPIINVLFWILILQGRPSAIAKSFLGWSFFIALWGLGYGVTLGGFLNYESTLVWNKYCQTMAMLIGPFFFRFAAHVIDKPRYYRSYFRFYLIFGIVNAIGLFFTPYYVKGLWSFGNYVYQPLGGPLYIVFAGFFVWCTVHAYWIVLKDFPRARGVQRRRIILWLWATGVAYFGGGTLFVQGFGIPLPSTGVYLILGYVIVIGYSIHKYQFMDIATLVRKTLAFAGLSFFVFAAFSVPLFLIPNIAPNFIKGGMNWWLLVLVGMAVAALVGPVNQFLADITDKYLFQKKTNYRVLLREATEYLAHVASLRSLARTIVAFFLKKARLANASVYAFASRGSEALLLTASRPAIEDPGLKQINLSHPIVNYFSHHQGPIEIATLKELNKTKEFLKTEDIEKVIGLMNALKAEAAVPCFGGKVAARLEKKDVYLKAILFLGHQKSDEPYSEEDLDVFFTLGQESSIAFENARLYDEVVERTRMLEQTNTDLSDANEKLKVTQASLIVAEKNATMVGMAKAIGHEVNNPLSTVGGRAVWIYKDELRKCREAVAQNLTSLPEHAARELEKRFLNIEDNAKRIEKSAKRIEVVVKTLTDILKDTKGEKGPLSLLVLCREAREATRFLTYDENLSGCQVIESIAANVVIFGNLEQLLQVFINMIKNAYEAMLGQPERRIEIIGNIDSDNPKMARIEFVDNGPGIPEDALPKIWGQGFSTKTVKEEHIGAAGQGQGLFICKHVIESIHNGEIFAESTPGKGTTFVIKVPLADLEG